MNVFDDLYSTTEAFKRYGMMVPPVYPATSTAAALQREPLERKVLPKDLLGYLVKHDEVGT